MTVCEYCGRRVARGRCQHCGAPAPVAPAPVAPAASPDQPFDATDAAWSLAVMLGLVLVAAVLTWAIVAVVGWSAPPHPVAQWTPASLEAVARFRADDGVVTLPNAGTHDGSPAGGTLRITPGDPASAGTDSAILWGSSGATSLYIGSPRLIPGEQSADGRAGAGGTLRIRPGDPHDR